jgi:cobalt-zinc-cadmium efflux system membrane fusion protein
MLNYSKNKVNNIIVCAIILAISINAQSCKKGIEKESADSGDRKTYIIPDSLLKTLKIDSVKQGQLINAITLTGQVDFNQDNVINIFPQISGTAQDIKVGLGDFVQQGQILCIVKSIEMAQYSSDILNAENNVRLAETVMQKNNDMYKAGLASKTDSLSSAIAFQQAKAELIRVQRVLKINGGNNTQGEYVIKAPISGFIVQKNVNNNQVIRTDNGNALFTISDLKNVWIWANVYESNVDNIFMGDNADINTISKPDRIFKGKVDKIMHILDPVSKAMKVRIVIDNADYVLKPQMFASVTITNPEHQQAIYIPTKALIFDHSQYYVLVYNGNGRATITPVEKLNTIGNKTYLSSGVNPNERVIASDVLQIYSELNN